MKILVFGDDHGKAKHSEIIKRKAKDVELLICLGDLTIFENKLKDRLTDLDKLGKKVLIIHGNHEDRKVMQSLCEKKDNLFFIHNGFFKTGKHIFIGYGGGGFREHDEEFEQRSRFFKEVSKGLKSYLVLHQPPFGIAADLVGKEHTGNKSFTKFIKETRPAIVFCGHIHEGFGKQDRIGKTLVVNPGPDGMIFEV